MTVVKLTTPRSGKPVVSHDRRKSIIAAAFKAATGCTRVSMITETSTGDFQARCLKPKRQWDGEGAYEIKGSDLRAFAAAAKREIWCSGSGMVANVPEMGGSLDPTLKNTMACWKGSVFCPVCRRSVKAKHAVFSKGKPLIVVRCHIPAHKWAELLKPRSV